MERGASCQLERCRDGEGSAGLPAAAAAWVVRKQLRQGREGEHERDAGDQDRRGDAKEDHSVPHVEIKRQGRAEGFAVPTWASPPALRATSPASGEDIAEAIDRRAFPARHA